MKQRKPVGKSALKRIDKAFQGLASIAVDQGWSIERTGGDHLQWRPPGKKQGCVTTPSTPSDKRARLNARAQLRQMGLQC